MYFLERFTMHYGWEGAALAAAILVTLGVQLYYYLFVYGAVPTYRINRRGARLKAEPPVSVVVPLFGEDDAFVRERLPLLLSQSDAEFEVVIVYVGSDVDFYDRLTRMRLSFPQLTVTKIEFNPRFPISVKIALNVGIKSARHEYLVLTTCDAAPVSDRWLKLLAKGFTRAEVVLGYCGLEHRRGLAGYLMRTGRMMQSADWIAAAVRRRPYRGIRHAIGLTKRLYFGANGFGNLNMNVGEDDLFVQQIATRDNTAVVLSPRATMREHCWGGWSWWTSERRLRGATFACYPLRVKNYLQWEPGSRMLFFAATATAIAVMPAEYKLAALALLLIRYAAVTWEVRRIALRLGERGMWPGYFLYDLLSPLHALWVAILLLRKDPRVWR